MRREGVVFNRLRREHFATNRTIHNCRCGRGPRHYAYVVEPPAEYQKKKALKAAATFVFDALQTKGDDFSSSIPSDLETVGVYSVESLADMNATHVAFVEGRLKHRDVVIRDAAARILSTFKQLEEEREAMQVLGFGGHRRCASLTKAERLRLVQALTSPSDELSGLEHTVITVDVKEEIVPVLEQVLRHCETSGWYKESDDKADKGMVKARRQWVHAQVTMAEDEDMNATDDSDDQGDDGMRPLGVNLFDFVDAALARRQAHSDNDYDFCSVASVDDRWD
ncbi:Aste57867_13167 [Aphanomyces stellatus]|uniref:Aste57867_13167 protein n=1 Tax=Aphanomyces stellatus TaxID=120398 RepID=A0A485KZ39_9STRA|nr:hypothetical protein As57867_013118 [Aphanomyces stellatus]VFT90008.1 Aste57867_13167 [Aphanomyces stellatus]